MVMMSVTEQQGSMVAQLSTSNDVILPDDIILAGENPSNPLMKAEEPVKEAGEPLRKKSIISHVFRWPLILALWSFDVQVTGRKCSSSSSE